MDRKSDDKQLEGGPDRGNTQEHEHEQAIATIAYEFIRKHESIEAMINDGAELIKFSTPVDEDDINDTQVAMELVQDYYAEKGIYTHHILSSVSPKKDESNSSFELWISSKPIEP
jgi:methionine synthase I (cobalamin-dependent)